MRDGPNRRSSCAAWFAWPLSLFLPWPLHRAYNSSGNRSCPKEFPVSTIIPHLTVHDAAAAIEFYKQALGAEELSRIAGPDGRRIIHAALRIGDATLFLSDEFPEMPVPDACQSPKTLGHTTMTIHVNSPAVDQTLAAAVAAGATVTLPVADMFWGERYGRFRDPFGHLWSVSTTIRKMSPEEMTQAARKAFANAPRRNP
jgi:PhnB protein